MQVYDPRKSLKVVFFATIFLFFAGILLNIEYLTEEHRRLDPWMGILVWVSDAVGLMWFTWYSANHFLLGDPLLDERSEPPRLTNGWWVAMFTLSVAITFDIWVCYRLAMDEHEGFVRSVVADGEIVSVTRYSAAEYDNYHLNCRFQDQRGDAHACLFRQSVHRKSDRFKFALPGPLEKAIRDRRAPFPIKIAYDPVLPARNWMADVQHESGNRFYAFSFCIRLFQLLAILNFGDQLRKFIKTNNHLPWWHDIHMALPFIVESAFLGFFGGLIWLARIIVALAYN